MAENAQRHLLLGGDTVFMSPEGLPDPVSITLESAGRMGRGERRLCVSANGEECPLPALPPAAGEEWELKASYVSGEFQKKGSGTLTLSGPAGAMPSPAGVSLAPGTAFEAVFEVETPANSEGEGGDPEKEYKGTAALADGGNGEGAGGADEFLLAGDLILFAHPEDSKSPLNFFTDLDARSGGVSVFAPAKAIKLAPSGKTLRGGRALFMEEDIRALSIPGCDYCMDGHASGGKGTVSFEGFSADYEPCGGKIEGRTPLTSKTRLIARFDVAEPARKTPGGPADPETVYRGVGKFCPIQ
ncbi:hypothetical protein EPICR_110005 [Candidatus Desulfarcum epimagneticum]|uniref:Uncharacterized protein n=1 Tax=uncultured Desulfobacteraceae bacterium TaxID=218296 RepID=A0A484HF22_9BACT|nr:hypothetical protein EPICR_110005 [uncultured Desulfobacteraceae bacterium]